MDMDEISMYADVKSMNAGGKMRDMRLERI